jgi:hypothetical protein
MVFMPVFLPPRQGVSQSVALAEAYTHATASVPELITLAWYHPTFVDDSGHPSPDLVVMEVPRRCARALTSAKKKAPSLSI